MNIIDSDANLKHSIILSMVMCLSLAHTLSADKVYKSGVSIHICPFEALFISISSTY